MEPRLVRVSLRPNQSEYHGQRRDTPIFLRGLDPRHRSGTSHQEWKCAMALKGCDESIVSLAASIACSYLHITSRLVRLGFSIGLTLVAFNAELALKCPPEVSNEARRGRITRGICISVHNKDLNDRLSLLSKWRPN